MILSSKKDAFLFRFLQLAVFAVFLGRAWQHIYWDAPFRVLLWDEGLMRNLMESVFDLTWTEYAGNPKFDHRIGIFIKGLGVFYLIVAIATLMIRSLKEFGRFLLLIGGLWLTFLALLYCKDRFYQIGQFFEYSLQFGSPFFLYYYLRYNEWDKGLILGMKVAVALTFICHGLYAIGYYPRPGLFLSMTMSILGTTESQSIQFLTGAAIADFAASIMIFLSLRWRVLGLLYCVCWGFATSMARIWAHFQMDWWEESMLRWLHETIMRFPHFLIPLLLLFLVSKKRAKKHHYPVSHG